MALVIIISTSSTYFMLFYTTLRIFMALMEGIYIENVAGKLFLVIINL